MVERLMQAGDVVLGEVPGGGAHDGTLGNLDRHRPGRFDEDLSELLHTRVREPGGRSLDRYAGPCRAVRGEQRRGDGAHADVALAVVEAPAPPAGGEDVLEQGRRIGARRGGDRDEWPEGMDLLGRIGGEGEQDLAD